MEQIIEIIFQPFMIRALIGGIMAAILCGSLGIFVTIRKESFIADAISHGSLTGIAIGILLSVSPTLFAAIIAVLMAVLITYLKRESNLSADSVIGIIFPFLFALGIIIINLTPGYKPALDTYLFGSILSINMFDLGFLGFVSIISGLFFYFNFHQILYVTFDSEAAFLNGINVKKYDYMISILTALCVIASVKIGGIILVTALFVIPATAARILSNNFSGLVPISIFYNIFVVVLGLLLSLNTPAGATIVVVSSLVLFGIIILKRLDPA